MCGLALNNTHTVEVCKLLSLSNCSSVSGIVNDLSEDAPYERRVIAGFTDLEEDRNYLLTLNLLYNGGVTQQSHPLRISESS